MSKMLHKIALIFGCATLFLLASCTSEVQSPTIGGQSSLEGKGSRATIILPSAAVSKTLDVHDKAFVACYTVELSGQSKDINATESSVSFSGLSIGETELKVTAWADVEKTTPVEYQETNVTIQAGADNKFTATLDFIYADTAKEFSNLTGTVSVTIDWSATKNTAVRTIQLMENNDVQGNTPMVEQTVEEGATSAVFSQEVPFTSTAGTFVHFRFLDAERNELGTSAMEVMCVASGQTSTLVDPFNQGAVSTLKLTANALAGAKGVMRAELGYTQNPNELKLSWAMPSSYSGLKISFYDEKKSKVEDHSFTKNDLPATHEWVFSDLVPNTKYFADLTVLHDDGNGDYPSGTTTVNKISPIKLTSLAINDLASDQILQKGRSVTFTTTKTPEDATDLGYEWTSSDPNVLAVTDAKNGVFSVKGYGPVQVSVSSKAFGVSATKDLTVTLGQVKNVEAKADSSKIKVTWSKVDGAESYTVTKYEGEALPSTTTGITGTLWEDTELKTGIPYAYTITANAKKGEADISGTPSAKSNPVTPNEPVISITGATPTSVVASLAETGSTELVNGQELTISLAEEVEGIINYEWYLNGKSIAANTSGKAQVVINSETDGLLTSKTGQVQNLTLVMSDGTKKYSGSFQFNYVGVAVNNIVIENEPDQIVRGSSFKLAAHIEPLDADVPDFTWTSSNEKIATIDGDGTVTIASDLSSFTDEQRKVTFTATSTSNSSVQATTKEITVIAPVESIRIDNAPRTLFVGGENGFGTEQLAVTFLPADANASEKVVVSQYSEDEGILKIDENQLVTAIGAGSASVTVEGLHQIKATWTPTQVLKGHILKYKSYARGKISTGKHQTTNFNEYVEDTKVKTEGNSYDYNDYYFKIVYTNSPSGTPDSTTFQDLSALGLSIDYSFPNGKKSLDVGNLLLESVSDDAYAFIVRRKASLFTDTVTVTVSAKTSTGETVKLQTMSFTPRYN